MVVLVHLVVAIRAAAVRQPGTVKALVVVTGETRTYRVETPPLQLRVTWDLVKAIRKERPGNFTETNSCFL